MQPLFAKAIFLALILLPFPLGGLFRVSAATLPEVHLTTGPRTEVVPATTVSSWLRITSKKELRLGHRSEVENTGFCPYTYNFCDFALPRGERTQVKVSLTTTAKSAEIQKYLDELTLKTDIAPHDAIFRGDAEGKIVVSKPEVSGQALDKETSLELLMEALEQKDIPSPVPPVFLTLPIVTVEPKVKSGDAERLGLKELIGSGSSNFAGSPKNRIYNINRSLQQFQSLIIGPGEEFSFVEHLGEVDEAHGYLPELVIRNNKTEPEFGGGICQVSSTVFRAAIYSGMKITERRNHSYPVRYYQPYGLDATIYVPKPDFRFVNNTAHSIMMQSEVVGTQLIFRFFGTKDGRQVAVDGPHILESNPDGSMKTVFTQIVTDANGQEMIKDVFPSNYKSPALFPKPGEESKLTAKPKNWSNRQWQDYKRLNP